MADKKIKVLLVEDEETLSQMYSVKFDREGFDVKAAMDGETAVAIAAEFSPDIILMDIILPKIDGFEALKQIKQQSGTKNTPVVMLTNLGQTEDVDKGKKLGAVDYLVKANCTPMDVVKKVKEVLSKS